VSGGDNSDLVYVSDCDVVKTAIVQRSQWTSDASGGDVVKTAKTNRS